MIRIFELETMRFRKSKSQNVELQGGFEPFAPQKGSSRRRPSHSDSHKTYQLCAQVREVLSFALAERCDDPLLEAVSIRSVLPAPDASRLLVTVGVESEDELIDTHEVLASLKRIRPELRREIAQEISRKRTPELIFDVAYGGLETGNGSVDGRSE